MLHHWLLLDRVLFDKEGGGGGGDATPPPAETPGGEPGEQTPPDSGDDPTGGEQPGKTPKKLELTQEQLTQRLERAKASGRKDYIQSLGFSDENGLKDILTKGTEALQENMTQTERLQSELETEKQARLDEAAKREAAEQRLKLASVERKAVSKMSGVFHDPDAVLKLLDMSLVDMETEDFVGLDDAIEKAKEQYPWAVVLEGEKPKTPPKKKDPVLDPPNPDTPPKPGQKTDEDRRRQFFGAQGTGAFFEPKEDGVSPVTEVQSK